MVRVIKFAFLFRKFTFNEIIRKKNYLTVKFRYICSDVKFLTLLSGINHVFVRDV